MPDELTPEELAAKEAAKTPPGVPLEEVTSLVDTFRESLKEMRKDPVPVAAAPTGPSQQERLDTYQAAKTKANELAASGEYADALEHMYQTWTSLSATEQTGMTDTPAFKGLLVQAERMAKGEHAEMFKTYGAEISAVIADKPAEERINPEAWDQAVREVKAAHVDEILQLERDKFTADAQAATAQAPAPVAGGSRGRQRPAAGTPVELDAEQIAFASQINFSPERYATAVQKYQDNADGPGSVRLMDEDEGGSITPGKF